ncbi:hypothetical protein ACU4GD_16230 [Cupriavidus basilensis]
MERHNIGLSAQRRPSAAPRPKSRSPVCAPIRCSSTAVAKSRPAAVSAKPPRTHEFEVEIPIELGGKRSARACRQQQPAV